MPFARRAEAIELDATWSTTYRENIRVRVCFGSFLQWIPELNDQATGCEKLIAAVQNVLDLANACEFVNPSDGVLWLSGFSSQLYWNTRSEASVASGYDNNGYYWYLLGYQGQDGSTLGNTGRKNTCSGYTPWGDKRLLDTIYFGPILASGSKQCQREFVLYYAAP
jgi:hypothetical protein